MSRIFLPSTGPEDWRRLLAEPIKHWLTGYSARALAHSWEEANGFPLEIERLFAASALPAFQHVELLQAIPEYQVALPGGGRPSQNDLFVLAKTSDGALASIMVEGKVAEPFGPTIGEWLAKPSAGKRARLQFLTAQLGLPEPIPAGIRYQLLHRIVSAILEARRFSAAHAIMLVHSFSQKQQWFEDYAAFVNLFGAMVGPDQLIVLRQSQELTLSAGWVTGSSEYLLR